MGDMGEIFGAMREATKQHRAQMLEQADTKGWEEITEYHYRRHFGPVRIDWWPSGGKCQVFQKGKGAPRMVYGHCRTNQLIAKLKKEEANG